jgi:AcrR family transcriptional regulator
MNEEDKRVIRTRKRLAEALLALSQEEGYDAVTIQEITDRAGINYRTFFRHYEGKDELLRDVLRTTMAGLREVMPPPTPDELNAVDFESVARRKGRTLYEFVGGKSDLFRVLLQSGPAALVPMQEIAEAEAKNYFAHLPAGTVPPDLIANHMVTSTFAFIQWWLDSDMAHSPAEMGDYAAQLIMLPIRRLLLQNKATS